MRAQGVVSELMKGVHVIDTYAHCALLTGQRLILVDTSSEAAPTKVFDAMKQVGVKPSDLTSIVITHTHPDHVTGLHEIKKQAPQAKVAAHEIEAPFISKEKTYTGPPGPQTQKHTGVRVDVRLKDGQTYDGLLVIHTPGHTLGHISLLDRERRLLLAGDAVRTEDGLGPMEDIYNVDPNRHRESIRKLTSYDFDALVCGHGPPIASDASEKLKAAAGRL